MIEYSSTRRATNSICAELDALGRMLDRVTSPPTLRLYVGFDSLARAFFVDGRCIAHVVVDGGGIWVVSADGRSEVFGSVSKATDRLVRLAAEDIAL